MADGNGSSAFTIRYEPEVLAAITRWAVDMAVVGRGPEFAAAIRQMRTRLRTRPNEWGDILRDYDHIDAVEHRGLIKHWFFVWYGVENAVNLIVVRRVLSAPGSPLSDPA